MNLLNRYQAPQYVVIISMLFILAACSSPQTQKNSGISVLPELLEKKIIAEDGYVLPLRQHWPKSDRLKGIVIALHGFNDYSKAFEGMCQYYVDHDFACISYDQRGFGATDLKGIWPAAGRLQKDLIQIIQLVRKTNSEPIYVAGESMGGAVIITAAQQSPAIFNENVSGLILFAPAVWARSTQPWYQRWSLWLAVHTFPSWTPTGESLGVQATDNIEALREMGRDENVIKATRIDTLYGLTNLMDRALKDSALKDNSLKDSSDLPENILALYGDKDEVIPKQPICIMLKEMSKKTSGLSFKHYSDGYHMLTRDLQAKRVFEDSVLWMSGELKTDDLAVTDFCH